MSEEEIRKTYKCGHLCDYSPKNKMCRAIEKIIEQQKEIETLKGNIEQLQFENSIIKNENKQLNKDISNMYDEIISIFGDEFNLTRNEVLELLGGEYE